VPLETHFIPFDWKYICWIIFKLSGHKYNLAQFFHELIICFNVTPVKLKSIWKVHSDHTLCAWTHLPPAKGAGWYKPISSRGPPVAVRHFAHRRWRTGCIYTTPLYTHTHTFDSKCRSRVQIAWLINCSEWAVGGRVDLWAAPVADNECTCRDPCLDKYRQFDSRRSEPIHLNAASSWMNICAWGLQLQTHLLTAAFPTLTTKLGVYLASICHCSHNLQKYSKKLRDEFNFV
jgi:hypothetical protein